MVVSGADNSLWHYYRDPTTGIWTNSTWSQGERPITSGSGSGLADGRLQHPGAAGGVAMVQYDVRYNAGLELTSETHANFEVVVVTPANTMAHYYRDNSNGNQTWYATEEFGVADFPSMVKCDDLRSLEVIAAGDPGGLFHWRRDVSGGPWTMTRMFAPSKGSGAAGFALDPRPPSPIQ